MNNFLKYYESNKIDIEIAYNALSNFRKNYGTNFLKNISLEDYCIGFGNKKSYSYQLEHGTNILGSIKGGSSYKFGVFYSKLNEDFKFSSRYKNEDNALDVIKKFIVDCINYEKGGETKIIFNSNIPNLVKNKIFYLYNPTEILPIFSEDILSDFLEKFNIVKSKEYILNNKSLLNYFIEKYNIKKLYENEKEKVIIGIMYYLFSDLDTEYESLKILFVDNIKDLKDYDGIGIFLQKDDWNDFGYQTSYWVKVKEKSDVNNIYTIGRTKIIYNKSNQIGLNFKFPFNRIDDNFCSFANDERFYAEIKELGRDFSNSILEGLNDLIMKDDEFISKFQHIGAFNQSLLRDNDKSYINICKDKYNLDKEAFNSKNTLEYPLGLLDIEVGYLNKRHRLRLKFDFKYNNFGFFRINSIIGKNGIGKTTSLLKISKLLSKVETGYEYSGENILNETDDIYFSDTGFDNINPFDFDKTSYFIDNKSFNSYSRNNFSKIIGISYGLFEADIDGGFHFLNNSSNGIFCSNSSTLSEKIQEVKTDKSNLFLKKIKNTFNEEKIDNFDIEKILDRPELSDNLSSGYKVLLSTIIDIITNIKPNSLILFDEPETHLHPEFVSILVRILHNLLEEFNSYMIIGTHSPIIVQQIPSQYINKIVDEGNWVIAKKLDIESFGNDLSEIIYDVFGGEEEQAFYKTQIKFLKEKKLLSREKILDFFNNKLPLNTRLFLDTLYKNNEENND